MKARTFTAKGITEVGDTSGWTDTAEDKQRKLDLELQMRKNVKDRRSALGQSSANVAPPKPQQRDVAMSRGPSLLEQHQKSSKSTSKPESRYRGWDRERDLVRPAVDGASFNNIVQQAKQLGSKFSRSSR